MKLTNNQKVLLGIIHFLPIIGFAAYFIFFFSFFFSNIENLENNTGESSQIMFFKNIIGAFVILIVTLLIYIGIKIFDIIHLIKSNKNDKSNKRLFGDVCTPVCSDKGGRYGSGLNPVGTRQSNAHFF